MSSFPAESHHQERPLAPRWPLVLLLGAIVVVFRAAAFHHPSSMIVIPESLAIPLNSLGLLYLVCGVWVWLSRPSHLSRVFLLIGLGGAIHWGGTIATGNSQTDIALLVFYAAATALGDAAFLDFALRYPHKTRPQGFPRILLYLVAIVSCLAIPIAPFLPRTAVEAGLGGVITIAFLMAIAGGVVFVVKWIRASPTKRRVHSLTAIVVVLVLASVFELLADAGLLPGRAEAWTLLYAFEPLVLTWALTRNPVSRD